MKERTVYDKYKDPEKYHTKNPFTYYKKKQVFAWRFYIRIIQDGYGWFTPCDQCQEKITLLWNESFSLLVKKEEVSRIVIVAFRGLCKKCMGVIEKRLKEYPIIIGNKKYEPSIELSRRWIDDDDSIEDATKEEYDKFNER